MIYNYFTIVFIFYIFYTCMEKLLMKFAEKIEKIEKIYHQDYFGLETRIDELEQFANKSRRRNPFMKWK